MNTDTKNLCTRIAGGTRTTHSKMGILPYFGLLLLAFVPVSASSEKNGEVGFAERPKKNVLNWTSSEKPFTTPNNTQTWKLGQETFTDKTFPSNPITEVKKQKETKSERRTRRLRKRNNKKRRKQFRRKKRKYKKLKKGKHWGISGLKRWRELKNENSSSLDWPTKDAEKISRKDKRKRQKFRKLRTSGKFTNRKRTHAQVGSSENTSSKLRKFQPRWKRLSHNPRHHRFRWNNRRAFSNNPPSWMRSLHHHHNQLASSIRNRLRDHIERTRRQWLNRIDPKLFLRNPFKSFTGISDPPFLKFPSSPNHILPKEKKPKTTSWSNHPDRNFFVPFHHRFGIKKSDKNPSTAASTPCVEPTTMSTPIASPAQTTEKSTTPFIYTTERPILVTVPPTTTGGKTYLEILPEIDIGQEQTIKPSISSSSFHSSPSTLSTTPITLLDEIMTSSSSTSTQQENGNTTTTATTTETPKIYYGNDIAKSNPIDVNSGDVSGEDWEWVMAGEKEDSYDHPEKGEDDQTSGEHSDEEVTTFDVDHCLQCPPKRKVHAPRGQDCVPLLIPTLKDECQLRKKLSFHVEVSPGSPRPGAFLGEGHYFINISFLGTGQEKNKPLSKTCTYDFEVQVYKCPTLPNIPGGSKECTADRAWGSKCTWACEGGRSLLGSSLTSCGGPKNNPKWSHNPPICKDVGCPIPKGIAGTSLSCSLPIPRETLQERLPTLTLYPEGSLCNVRCVPGYKSKGSDALVSKCSSTGVWIPDIKTCCVKKKTYSKPVYGDCPNLNVQLQGPGVVHLLPPRFYTDAGKLSNVWCDLNTIRREGRHCRTCKAHDNSQDIRASCRQCIHVSSKLGCPTIQAPVNGNLECRNTAQGDITCKISCRNGYLLPPYISNGNVRCQRGRSMWDFQSYRSERLPACVIR